MQNSANVVPLKGKVSMDSSARAKLARLPAPVHYVQEKGKQCLQRALRAVFDNADDALFALADKATSNQDQNLFFESMREVRISRRRMEAEFAEAIDAGFAGLIGDKPSASEHDYDSYGMSSEELSLVQDDELEELVAVDSMIAKATTAHGEALQYLSLRLDSLVPQKVYHKNNPLGPDAVCHAFVQTAKALDADIKAKLVLFKLFDQYVVGQLGEMYRTLNDLLIEQNVLPSLNPTHLVKIGAPTRGAPVASAAVAAPQPAMQPTTGSPAYATAGGAVGTTVAGTGGVMVSGSAAAGAAHGGNGSSVIGAPVQGQELVQILSQLQAGQVSTFAGTTGGVAMPAPAEIGALVAQAIQNQFGQRQVANTEHDVINLVKMLFEFILDDRSLAEPMKALIGRLQIPILKVAVIDKSFFSKSGHPARRLLNEMATACLGWAPEQTESGTPNDPLYNKINEIVQFLLNEFEDDVSVFNEVLADFVSFIERERKRASILERRTIDAEAGKAKAEAARATVNAVLKEKVGNRKVPSAVQRILDQAWSNFLFLICLKQGTDSDDWQQAVATAEDLIWSATTPIDKSNRQHLLALLPKLLKRIRAGMEQIAFNPFELTKLLNELQKVHMARLQQPAEIPAAAPTKPAAVTPAAERPSSVTPIATPAAAKARAEAKPAPQAEAKSMSAAERASAEKALADIDQSYLQLVSKLTMGTWFEISEKNAAPYRCRLAAIIKATDKYIFVNRSGIKVAEKTREDLALAMKDGNMRLLDDSMLFDRALESVIGNLRQSRKSNN